MQRNMVVLLFKKQGRERREKLKPSSYVTGLVVTVKKKKKICCDFCIGASLS